MTPRVALDRGLGELALALPAGGREQLLEYLTLLAKWNRTYNLTAIRAPLAMVSHHLLDSLAVLPHLPMPSASQKKAAFLRQAVIELGLSNVEVYEGRVQAWRPAARFAVVISRAFAELAEFAAACRHLVAPRGFLAAMKGKVPQDTLGCEIVKLTVPLLDAERHLVLCRA